MNKYVILGGGVAGIACAIRLQKAGFEVQIFEKQRENSPQGHAFILLDNGLQALDRLGVKDRILQQSHVIDRFHARTVNGLKHQIQAFKQAVGIRRTVLVDILREELLPKTFHFNKAFSHFKEDGLGRIRQAVFHDGTIADGDIFIGADGIWSKTRRRIEPDYHLTPTRVRELVSVVHAPEIVKKWSNTFLKTHYNAGGFALGMLPCDEEHLVWFIQYDCQHPELMELTLEEQKKFLTEKVKNWAAPIPELLAHTDIHESYVWHTTDMDTLTAYHHQNLVLVGDAAHVFLPFTSQGVSSALEDALTLTSLLVKNPYVSDVEQIFQQYTIIRKHVMEGHLQAGRRLKQQFLAAYHDDKELEIPLVMQS